MNTTGTSLKKLVLKALFIALVTVSTMIIQIPVPMTEGYIHFGDSMIFLIAVFFGRRNGAIAGGIYVCGYFFRLRTLGTVYFCNQRIDGFCSRILFEIWIQRTKILFCRNNPRCVGRLCCDGGRIFDWRNHSEGKFCRGINICSV